MVRADAAQSISLSIMEGSAGACGVIDTPVVEENKSGSRFTGLKWGEGR